MPIRRGVVVALVAMLPGILPAALPAQEDSTLTAEEFEATLGYQSGTIDLKDGLATLKLPSSYRFLDQRGSERLLVDAWGNPKGSAEDVLGMIVPGAVSPLSDSGWAVVITYEEDGYVDDKDAETIDYGKLLEEMKQGVADANKDRREQGYEPITLVGWAEPPTYDQANHKLYWAKELQFGDAPHHTLNYNIRVLGRRGVLVLNAVSGMAQLATIKASMLEVMPVIEFGTGHRYTDFVSGDKVATYGIAGLVIGAVATKAGFFKVLLTALIAAKKLVLVGAAALAAAGKKLWARLKGDSPAPTA